MPAVTAQAAPVLRGAVDAARKRAIARSFDAAAPSYDSHAPVQRRVASSLARRIAALPLPAVPRVLEIGCGTGFLSAALLARLAAARFLFTDLSPAMAGRCRDKIARRGAGARFAVMDGEAPAVAPDFDLVASSLAFQWFLDLPAALDALAACLRPGGRLAFATLGAESLAEWRGLHEASGSTFTGFDYPSATGLRRMAQGARLRGAVAEERIVRRHPDVLTFLRELKSLGAGTPGPNAAVPGVGDLRRVLRRTEGAFAVTYHVLYGTFAAPGRGRRCA